jgi:peptidyl-prolyl cis-trans isomerase B (cyclophilin B)
VSTNPSGREQSQATRAPLGPPDATPLAKAPAAPEGDGTTATLKTAKGDIVVELYTRSAPVATQNFINLAEAGFYRNVVFHRIVPGFMIQGGDPTGTGRGGPGYTIRDEPFAGEYVRGTVAMARTPAPNSQGSQFFIVVGDATFLDKTYTIFGRVTSGMEIADAIVNGPRGGPRDDEALEPVPMLEVGIRRP